SESQHRADESCISIRAGAMRAPRCPAIVCAVCLAAFCLSSCATNRRLGNKLAEADGRRYIACEGGIWLSDDGNVRDIATRSYDVIFKDEHETTQHLTMVRSLAVTDLPASLTPACNHK